MSCWADISTVVLTALTLVFVVCDVVSTHRTLRRQHDEYMKAFHERYPRP